MQMMQIKVNYAKKIYLHNFDGSNDDLDKNNEPLREITIEH